MSSEKYIGLDVHQATISVAVVDSKGKLIIESILETKASTTLELLAGLCGTLSVTFDEGTWAAWLYDLLKSHVAHLIVRETEPSQTGLRRRRESKAQSHRETKATAPVLDSTPYSSH